MTKGRIVLAFLLILSCTILLSCKDSVHVHQWNEGDVIVDATCQAEGRVIYTCMVCGEKKIKDSPKIDHVMGDRITESPTCLESGSVKEICAMCGDVMKELVLPALGHDMWFAEHQCDPTCEHEGEDLYACSRCNVREIRYIPALGHDFTGATEIIEPTPESDGSRFIHCRRCNLAICFVIPRPE